MRKGQEVSLDGLRAAATRRAAAQRAVQEGIVAGLTSRSYHRAVQSVLDGYGIEKSSVSREFVAASAAQLKTLCEKKLNELELVAVLIDGIHLGQQVLVVASGHRKQCGTSTCWACGKERRKIPRWFKHCWKTWRRAD